MRVGRVGVELDGLLELLEGLVEPAAIGQLDARASCARRMKRWSPSREPCRMLTNKNDRPRPAAVDLRGTARSHGARLGRRDARATTTKNTSTSR